MTLGISTILPSTVPTVLNRTGFSNPVSGKSRGVDRLDSSVTVSVGRHLEEKSPVITKNFLKILV